MDGATRRGSRPWPWGLLAALPLIALVELAIAQGQRSLLSVANWSCAETRKAAGSIATSRDVLIFGDSLIKLGLAPSLVESEAGLSGFNLGISGGQVPMSHVLLRHALRAGARPRAVIVSFSPSLMVLPPSHNDENWSFLLSFREAVELALTTNDRGFAERLLTRKLLPSMRNRFGLRTALREGWRTRQARMARWVVATHRRGWKLSAGAQIVPGDPDWRTKPIDGAVYREVFFARPGFHPTNLAYLHRLLRVTAARRIPVLWILPPIMAKVQDECERSGLADVQTQFLQDLQRRYRHLRVLDGRDTGYDPGVFMDPLHLGRPGAQVFSRAVGAFLRRQPLESAAAWNVLPTYQTGEDDPSFLDLVRIATTPRTAR